MTTDHFQSLNFNNRKCQAQNACGLSEAYIDPLRAQKKVTLHGNLGLNSLQCLKSELAEIHCCRAVTQK